MNTNPEQDPWDRIHDADRDPVHPFTTGEICFWIFFFLAILAGLCVGGYVGCCWIVGLDPWP